MTGHIKINNAVFYAYHGATADEQAIGAQFEIDLDMQVDIAYASQTDMLSETLNYETVYADVQKIVLGQKYYLIETLAAHIVGELFRKYSNILHLTARIRKPNAPVKGVIKSVEVELSLSKDEYERGLLAAGKSVN